MRLSSLFFLGAAAFAVAAPDDASDEGVSTYFNGKKVPPMLELTPSTWAAESKASTWLMVKHYSPWCPHCKDFAPVYQTLYEYYYTSTPAGSGNQDASFTSFYDFRFASINCIAYGDLCTEHDINSYPTTILYKNSEPVQLMRSAQTIEDMSKKIEDALEKTKPGTRPLSLQLPKPGDKSSPNGPPPVDDLLKPAKGEPGKVGRIAEIVDDGAQKVVPAGEAPKAVKDTGAGKVGRIAEIVDEGAQKVVPAKEAPAKAIEKGTAAKAAGSKSTEWKRPRIPTFEKPKKPKTTPNLDGKSVSLTAEMFHRSVAKSHDLWFIKFYAPWCHHCQAMAPNWEQLAKQMKGQLNVGEVNCDAQSRLCKDVGVRGYPTIHLFKGGERVEYDGLRGYGDLVQFANKALDIVDGVMDVDAASFKELEKTNDVIFVYFYDHATTSEDFMALERLPLSLIGRAKLVKTADPEMYERFKITTWPRLIVSREGRPTYYTPLTPHEMRNIDQVLDWMKSVWLPMVPELTASNAREIMDGNLVVLGILSREDQDSYTSAIREMKSAANEWMDKQIQLFQLERQELRDTKQLRIEEAEDRGDQRRLQAAKGIRISMDMSDRKQVGFAWVDGHFWQRWIRTTYGIDIKNGDRVIINDEDNRRYWDETITENPITPSRTSILETLNKVTASPPKIKPKLTISSIQKIFFDVRITFTEHPYLTTGCIFGLAFGAFSWFRGRTRRRGGHFRLEDKVPLLPGNVNGKVD